MQRYFRRRPDFVLQAVADHFGLDPAVTVSIDSESASVYTVDGYEQQGAYVGAYFPGQAVRVELDATANPTFRHWRVNGEVVGGTTLELTVSEPTTVRPVFRNP